MRDECDEVLAHGVPEGAFGMGLVWAWAQLGVHLGRTSEWTGGTCNRAPTHDGRSSIPTGTLP